MKKKKKQYLIELNEHLSKTTENKLYAVKRMDIVLITLSSAGIYFNFEFFKFIYSIGGFSGKLIYVFTPGIFFGVTIILNILSHWAGYHANKHEETCSNLERDRLKEKKNYQEEIQKLECRIETYNKLTASLNGISSITLISGILSSLVLIILTF
jgi:hypothetical protein